jgi:hypothetical protein
MIPQQWAVTKPSAEKPRGVMLQGFGSDQYAEQFAAPLGCRDGRRNSYSLPAYEGFGNGNLRWWIPIGGGESHPVIQLFRRLLSMSAASVRTSGRRDSFPVFRIAAGKRGESGFLWLFTR